MADLPDEIADYLDDGFVVAGFTTAMMAAGALVHTVLLQKESTLVAINVVKTGEKELGRTVHLLSPKPKAPEKKGWLG